MVGFHHFTETPQPFYVRVSTHGPHTRYYVIDTRDNLMVTWSDDRAHAHEWCDLYNEESTSPDHMYGMYCECDDCLLEN